MDQVLLVFAKQFRDFRHDYPSAAPAYRAFSAGMSWARHSHHLSMWGPWFLSASPRISLSGKRRARRSFPNR
jgi:hypothetical protein